MSWPHRLLTGQLSDHDIRLIRVFRVVAECGGFSAAEAELGVVKSTISKQIGDLEIRVGARLCERGRSGFALTNEGQSVYDASTELLKSIEKFRVEINNLKGEFSIGLLDSIITKRRSKLSDVISEFVTLNPDLELKVIIGSASEINQAVIDRRIDIGISVIESEILNVNRRFLFDEQSYLYCGKNHELFNLDGSDLDIGTVTNHALAQHGYSKEESNVMKKWNLMSKAICHQCEAVAVLILSGKYLGFLPEHFCRSWVNEGEMRAILPEKLQKLTKIEVISTDSSDTNPVITRFYDLINKHEHLIARC